MRVIHKFPIRTDYPSTTVMMPVGSKIIHVAMQGDTLMLWAEVEPDAQMESRRFAVAGTGWLVPPGKHLGSVFQEKFVWHVYDMQERPADA